MYLFQEIHYYFCQHKHLSSFFTFLMTLLTSTFADANRKVTVKL